MRSWLLACLMFCGLHLPVSAAVQFDAARLAQTLDARWLRLFPDDQLRDRADSRDLANFALDGVASGHAPTRIERALQSLVAMQDKNPTSKTWGNIHWYYGDERIVDRNGIEFVTRHAVLIWLLYADRLTPAQRAPLLALLNLAKTGITRHDVRISYTNIFLMKAWNLIALGEGLSDAPLAAQGYKMLADWLAYTARTGINEYLSPSYYDVDMENLALIANLSRNPQAQQMARDGLEYFWHDIALNWYSPANRLGGTHSRDYNRLFNVGGINHWARQAGWIADEVPTLPANPYQAYAWSPPSAVASAWLSRPFSRTVSTRWGEEAEKRHTHTLGRNFSIGSAEAGYTAGHDNSPLVINLGAGQDVPIINFFMDGRRDYYGMNKTLEAGSGHMKALHLRPFLSSVQQGSDVLFTASVRDSAPINTALESVITLPADAEYWLDDVRIDLYTQTSRWQYDYAPNNTTTFIDVKERDGRAEVILRDRDNKAGVGISRVFAVEAGKDYRLGAALQGGEVSLYLNYLDAGKKLIGSEQIKRVKGGDGQFAVREFMARAPVGAVWCKAWLYSSSSATTEIRVADLYFDAMTPVMQRLGGFDFSKFRAQAITVPAGANLFVRRQGAVAALRLLGAWDVAGKPVGFTLHNDGLAYRALRLTATHASERSDGRGSIAVWAQAAEGIDTDTHFAAFRQKVAAQSGSAMLKGDVLEAAVGQLHLVSDVVAGKRLLREGMTLVPPDVALWVDGRDVGRELLGKYLPVH